MTVNAAKLEKLLLGVIASPGGDDWLALTIGDLRNRIVELDDTMAQITHGEMIDCLCDLSKLGQIRVEKFLGTQFVPLDSTRHHDEFYVRVFFGRGDFRMRLTHAGRKSLDGTGTGHAGVESAVASDETSELDDRLPLYRRRVFDADLVRLSQEALDIEGNLVMIMIDIDHFKHFNDTHGHPIGDEVLIAVSKIVAGRSKGKGKAYRYGGEEITLLLPNYMVDEGLTLAEILRKQIEQSEIGGKKLKVTASLGLAGMPDHAKPPSELLKVADAALYEAKHLGRNLVRVFGEQAPAERQRTTERKRPVPGALSDDDRERIRITHFTGGRPECPKDGTKLPIMSEFDEVTKRTPSIIVLCPICGLREIIEGIA